MDRRQLVLATLATANGASFTPVQIQKAIFLIDKNLPDSVVVEHFQFAPYDYGPYDSGVYGVAEALRSEGLAQISMSPNGRWKVYAATSEGISEGQKLLSAVPEESGKYIVAVSQWVRSLGFSSLVKSIYQAYPEMKANSIFSD